MIRNTSTSRKLGKFCTHATALATALGTASCSSSAGSAAQPCPPVSGSQMVANPGTSSQGDSSSVKGGNKGLRGHMLSASQNASDRGRVGDQTELPITVSLALNNENQLEQDLSDIYNPGSPKFHKFLKPAEFRAKYGPTQAQVNDVTSYLTQQGMHSVSVDANGMLVHAVGNAQGIGNAFGTELHQYQDSKGRSFRAPSRELQIPANLSIQGVHGLQDLMKAHTNLHQLQAGSGTKPTSHDATGPSGGFAPADIRTAYNLPASPDASGQTLAVFELDGYTASDITGYESNFNLPNMPLQNVLVNGATGSAGGGAAEVTLDIELMIGLAPNASKILVYEGTNDEQGMLATYSKIASDNLAQSVSTSWGNSEDGSTSSFIQSENTIFMQMAAQGQTIYSAAGDSGADDNGSSLSVDDPSSQPYVVGVGGTSLTTNSSGARVSETTWNDSSGGGGGGISSVWTIPTWQQGLATAANMASSTMRNVPDVALNADINTGYSIYYQGGWSVWGGTSCAAPQWAAFNALANRARAAKGMGPIGYANPVIYAIGKGSRYTDDFFDIADGSTNGHYPAVTGYDDATGWGTFNATNLLQDLSQNPAPGTTTSSGGSPTASTNSCGSGG